jgi:hypothetical protein
VSLEVLRFVMAHPGCVRAIAGRRAMYTDAFRQKIVELCAESDQLSLARFAAAALVPLDTLEDWMRIDRASPLASDAAAEPTERSDRGGRAVQTVVDEWKKWHGPFGDFCTHLNEHCRVPFKRTLIGSILHARGERTPSRREGRSRDERALRGAFETFFPNAQWVGDGTELSIEVCGRQHRFNLELMVDPYSGAFVGASVRDHEDSEAVVQSLRDAKQTTHSSPIAVLLDNKPSNHTPDVDVELESAKRIRATVERPQNKGHIEGGFGLFKQSMPELRVDGSDARSLAHSIAMLAVMIYFRAVNRRPRADRNGRTRVEIHADTPTPEQIKQAIKALDERCRRQEQARRTLAARQQPAIRKLLDRNFAELNLFDPERSIRTAIAAYTLSAIVDGIAIFKTKRMVGTLPEGADGRYLLGIVRNIAKQDETDQMREVLLRERIKENDQSLADLFIERLRIVANQHNLAAVLNDFVDHATATDRIIDRTFWLLAIVDLIREQRKEKHEDLARAVSRRINAAHDITPEERAAAIRYTIDRVVPLH